MSMVISKSTPAPHAFHAELFTDGSCPENPGPMGIGFEIRVLADVNHNAFKHCLGYRLGPGTNNRAEYLALIEGMREALRLCITHLSICSDSLLIVNQTLGTWKCKDGSLRHLQEEAAGLLKLFTGASLKHVPREENELADHLSKNPTCPTDLPPDVELDIHPPHPRKMSRYDAARIQWWWLTRRCQNEYRLARIFYGTPSHMGRIGRQEQYKDVTTNDLEKPR